MNRLPSASMCEQGALTAVETPGKDGTGTARSTDDSYLDVDHLFVCRDNADNADDRLLWCQQIVVKAMPLADHIAYRFAARGEPEEDLLQVARLALLKAVDRYDRDKGRFVSFAVPTVFGELRKHFRDNTWGMHVPRKDQEAALAVRDATNEMTQRMARTPKPNEVANELDLSRDEYACARVAYEAYRPLSLDASMTTGEEVGPRTRASMQGTIDGRYSKLEDLMVLAELVQELRPRQREILRMRFYECLKQSEIAQRIGVSQVHISRLLTATLQQLHVRMSADMAVVLAVVLLVTAHC